MNMVETKKADKLGELEDFIGDELGMELIDEDITSVAEQIKGWEKCIASKEFKNDDHKGDLEIIEELKKFKDYDCLYAICTDGGVWGQSYIIVDKELNYIGNVVTI